MEIEVATHIELRKNRAGRDRAYVANTRVRVSDIYAMAEIRGLTPDQIIEHFPHLSLGQVYAALSYFFDHRKQILEELHEDEQFAELMRSQFCPGPLDQQLGGSMGSDAVSS